MALFGISVQVRKAFDKVGQDMAELKSSMTSWIIHLNSSQSEMKKQLLVLDRRVRELEMEKVREMMK